MSTHFKIAVFGRGTLMCHRVMAAMVEHVASKPSLDDPLAPFYQAVSIEVLDPEEMSDRGRRMQALFPNRSQPLDLQDKTPDVVAEVSPGIEPESEVDPKVVVSAAGNQVFSGGSVEDFTDVPENATDDEAEDPDQSEGRKSYRTDPEPMKLRLRLTVNGDFAGLLRHYPDQGLRAKVQRFFLAGGAAQPRQFRVTLHAFDITDPVERNRELLKEFVQDADDFSCIMLQSLLEQSLQIQEPNSQELSEIRVLVSLLHPLATAGDSKSGFVARPRPVPVILAFDHSLVPASFASAPGDHEDFLQQLESLSGTDHVDMLDSVNCLATGWLNPVQFAHRADYREYLQSQWLKMHSGFTNEKKLAADKNLALRCVHIDINGIDEANHEIATLVFNQVGAGPEGQPEVSRIEIIPTLFAETKSSDWRATRSLNFDALPAQLQRDQSWRAFRVGAVLFAALAAQDSFAQDFHKALWVA